MWYVYVLHSKKVNHWYTGYTNDLKQRFKQHNQGQNFSTKHGVPWKLIYYEACCSKIDARAREKYLKSGMGKRYIRNRLKVYFAETPPLTGL